MKRLEKKLEGKDEARLYYESLSDEELEREIKGYAIHTSDTFREKFNPNNDEEYLFKPLTNEEFNFLEGWLKLEES